MNFNYEKYKLNGYILFNFLLLLIYFWVAHGTYVIYNIFHLMRGKEGIFSFLPIWGKRERDSILLGLVWYWKEESKWRLPDAESLRSKLFQTGFSNHALGFVPQKRSVWTSRGIVYTTFCLKRTKVKGCIMNWVWELKTCILKNKACIIK